VRWSRRWRRLPPLKPSPASPPADDAWIADLLEELRAPYEPAFERLDSLAVSDFHADPAAKRRLLEPFLPPKEQS
jgi:hypothetical protein